MSEIIQDLQARIRDRAFQNAVTLGMVPFLSSEVKFGHSPNTTAVESDIWPRSDVQPTYVFPAAGGEGLTIVATALDVTQSVKVLGLDENGLEKSEVVVLNGITPVALTGLWTAVNRVHNASADVLTGAVTVQGDGGASTNVFAYLDQVDEQTTQTIYTVPSDKVALLTNFSTAVNRTGGATLAAIFALKIQRPGKVFRTGIRYGIQREGTSNISSDLVVPVALGPSFRIKVSATPTAAGTDVSAEGSMWLIDKTAIDPLVLAQINDG